MCWGRAAACSVVGRGGVRRRRHGRPCAGCIVSSCCNKVPEWGLLMLAEKDAREPRSRGWAESSWLLSTNRAAGGKGGRVAGAVPVC